MPDPEDFLALAEIDGASAVEPIVTALVREGSDVSRKRVGEIHLVGALGAALANIKDPEALSRLLLALENSNRWVRAGAAKALGNIGDKRSVEALSRLVDDREEYVQEAAAKALERIGGPEPERALARYRTRQK